jgi:hypothetical protein
MLTSRFGDKKRIGIFFINPDWTAQHEQEIDVIDLRQIEVFNTDIDVPNIEGAAR